MRAVGAGMEIPKSAEERAEFVARGE